MTTKADMIAEIESDTERSDSDAIGRKIDAAIRQYQPRRFFFNESRSVTFSTAAGIDVYDKAAVSAEFYQIDAVFVTFSSTDIRELERVNYFDIEAPADTTASQPNQYAYINGALRLRPTPDDSYSVRVEGHIKLEGPSIDPNDTANAWMNEAYDLIMSRAKAELYAHRWEDQNNAQLMSIAEKDALNRLLGATHDKVSLGHLVPTDF